MTQAERLAEYRRKMNPMGAVLERVQILKGDKGDTGSVGPVGPQGIPGRDGRNGRDGESVVGPKGDQGEQGTAGRDGKDGKHGNDGKNGLSPSIDAIIKELKKLPVSFKDIKDAPDLTDLPQLIKFLKAGGFRGGGDTVSAGANITITRANGLTTISTPGGAGTLYSDTVSGTIDGVNKVFTVPNTIATALALYLSNSIYQPGVDFNVTGAKQITFTTAPDISLSGQPFWLSHS